MKYQWSKITGAFIMALLLIGLCSHARAPKHAINHFPLQGDSLFYAIDVQGQKQVNNQYSSGYHYKLLQQFAQEQDCAIRLIPLSDSCDVWEALVEEKVQVVVLDAARDSVPEAIENMVISGSSLNNKDQVWVYLKENYNLMQVMYGWFESFKLSPEYATLTSHFYTKNRKHQSLLSNSKGLSPYDDLIRAHGQRIGWDWRLLASLIYQESKFRMDVSSARGAIGLMQIKEATARQFGVENIYDPEENVRAGASMLQYLYKQLNNSEIHHEELTKFVLAAYNAGIGRITDCRNFARSQGKDPNNWEQVAEAIPLMSSGEHKFKGIAAGKFKGSETLRFVSDVLERYELYSQFLE